MRAAVWLAWSLAALSVAMFSISVALAVLALYSSPTTQGPSEWGTSGPLSNLLFVSPFLAFPLVGALISSRRPGNPIGWICLVAGLFWMFIFLSSASGAYELAKTGTTTSSVTLDALFQWIWVPPVGLLGIYMVLLFPDGRLPSKRWRPFALFAGGVMALICVMFVLVPGPVEDRTGALNPFGLESLAWAADVVLFVILLLPVCIVVSALSLVLRYRRSGAEVREQIKWVAFAACFAGAIYLSSILIRILFVTVSMDTATPDPFWLTLLDNFGVFSYAGIPVAMGFAILKYRLYDIDVIIN